MVGYRNILFFTQLDSAETQVHCPLHQDGPLACGQSAHLRAECVPQLTPFIGGSENNRQIEDLSIFFYI